MRIPEKEQSWRKKTGESISTAPLINNYPLLLLPWNELNIKQGSTYQPEDEFCFFFFLFLCQSSVSSFQGETLIGEFTTEKLNLCH
jgi:hypothetical protein